MKTRIELRIVILVDTREDAEARAKLYYDNAKAYGDYCEELVNEDQP